MAFFSPPSFMAPLTPASAPPSGSQHHPDENDRMGIPTARATAYTGDNRPRADGPPQRTASGMPLVVTSGALWHGTLSASFSWIIFIGASSSMNGSSETVEPLNFVEVHHALDRPTSEYKC